MIYTVTFNPAIDYIMNVNAFKEGLTNRSSSEEFAIGGKGINVSVMLNNLGVPNIALGFVAGFTGKELEENLERRGIKTDFVHLKNGCTRINVKLNSNTETEINGNGPKIEKDDISKLIEKLADIRDGDILVLSGSVPNGLGDEVYADLMGAVADKDVKVVVDAGGRLLTSTFGQKPFLIKPNLSELEEIIGENLKTDEKIMESAIKLQGMGVLNVLVSLGEKGAILCDQFGRVHKISAHKIAPKSTVGAGDSMVAGFLAGLNQGFEFALKLGNVCGAATAEISGIADAKAVKKFLN